ncbi:hypothetical protein K502DRAFT_363247 [Neoconidiobolus thromboides FSU 785]|nr:hypothetical protein K502DRAFT_363247 [Neoconidiobolus thromboides FSU 785]
MIVIHNTDDIKIGLNSNEWKPLLTKKAKNKSIFQGQFNIYWLFSSLLSLWFTLYKGVPLLFNPKTGPSLFMHLIFCTLICIQCIINLYFTPDMGPTYREMHKLIGKLCFLTTFLSTLFGLITTWNERYSGVSIFAISISIGGLFQVDAMAKAIYYIRKKDFKKHTYYASSVFYAGCMIPAYIRLPYLLNTDLTKYWDVLGWIIPIGVFNLAYLSTQSKRWY